MARIHQLGTFNSLVFGARKAGPESHIDDIAAALNVPGFEALLSEDILHEMWEKWVFIAAAAATTCLMRATIGDIMAADARDIPARSVARMRRDRRREWFCAARGVACG